MLLEYKPSWEVESTPVAAANSDSLNFVSSTPFQNMVSLTWENGVNFSVWHLLLVLICPFLLFSEKFQVTTPLYVKLDEMRASVPEQLLAKDQQPMAPKPINLDSFFTKFKIFYQSPRTKFAFNFVSFFFIYLNCMKIPFAYFRRQIANRMTIFGNSSLCSAPH
ncbi:unnamed protein product [Dibothriocephalus latus]|uniref:Uncharacterized protein n=1 Tax=Dibothriocephalus latus TaxID=60516 RepID=A0A3P7LZA8_DIBLA|nr:unnamed protein product [Dibothriocephalus latus]